MSRPPRHVSRAEWEAWYAAYLASPAWKRKTDLVFWRAHWLCEGCLSRPACQVHHLTYEHVGAELLFELVALCPECHRAIHPDKANTPG